MEGICQDLAQRGYFAAAAHYQRLEKLKDKNPLIPWKTPEDILAALRHLQKHPRVDPGRIAVLGFSRGAIVSLQIASQEPLIKAAIAYYALADFEHWLDVDQYAFPKSLLFRWVRNRMVKEVGATSWEEARVRLRETSPIHFAAGIEAPVLLIHGDKDRTFPVEQAKRLYGALPPGKGSELLIIPGAGHVFNFIDQEKGKFAWEKTIFFLNQYLRPSPWCALERGAKK
jgi:dipeptidyl aminopeptidase/acylaminoacyl peptidase